MRNFIVSKYKKKYCKQLPRLRCNGESVAEVCKFWGISKTTYYNWVNLHEEFATAHELGEVNQSVWWAKLGRQMAMGEVKGNAGVYNFSMKNIENWKDKVETEELNKDEKVGKIQIEVIAAKPKEDDAE